MADKNVRAPAPIRFDEQILPFVVWFCNTLAYEAKTGVYSFQLDETRFTLDTNLLREALEITLINQAHQFVSPPSGDAIMDFVNELGSTEAIHFVSRMAVNNLYQPWRAILSMINQCLTSKTSGYDRTRYPVLQMLWGIITSTNVDFAELMWEEFVQAIQTFLTDKANVGSLTKKGRKDKPHVIPYCRFTKLIICHLGRIHNIHQRSTSPFHLTEEDFKLGNLKFVPKGEVDEHDQKVEAKKEGKKKTTSTKQPKSKSAIKKSSKPAPASKPKPAKENPSKPSTAKSPKPKPAKEKSTKATPLQMAGKEATRPLPVVEGKGKAIVTEEQDAQSLLALHTQKRRSTTDQFILQRWAPTTEEASTRPSAQPMDDTSANIVRNSLSSADAETGARSDKTNSGGDTKILQITEDLGENVDKLENVEEKTVELNQDQAGSDPGETHESQPPLEQVHMDEDHARPDPGISCVVLVGPDPKPTHDEFMADLYPKNLEDAYAIGDQFINDKSTDDEPGKFICGSRSGSMVIVPLSSVFLLSLQRHCSKPDNERNDSPQSVETGSYKKSLPERIAFMKLLRHLWNGHRGTNSLLNEISLTKDDAMIKILLLLYQILISTKRNDMTLVLQAHHSPPAPQSSAWKTTNTREAPSSSSKQQSGPHSEQPVKDIPMPDTTNISDSEDTGSAHLPKNTPRPEWLKPIPEEDKPAIPEPAWAILTSHIPDAVNNLANA
ncbi:hypothetical protein Tco_0195692 [Tanacetum coccineum]